MFVELRQLKGHFVGCIDRTACNDQLFDHDLGGYGLFDSEAQFNEGIIKALQSSGKGVWVDLTCEMIRETIHGYEIVLTYGDLDPKNILVKGSEVVVLLD